MDTKTRRAAATTCRDRKGGNKPIGKQNTSFRNTRAQGHKGTKKQGDSKKGTPTNIYTVASSQPMRGMCTLTDTPVISPETLYRLSYCIYILP